MCFFETHSIISHLKTLIFFHIFKPLFQFFFFFKWFLFEIAFLAYKIIGYDIKKNKNIEKMVNFGKFMAKEPDITNRMIVYGGGVIVDRVVSQQNNY